jgi:hypothetical protein
MPWLSVTIDSISRYYLHTMLCVSSRSRKRAYFLVLEKFVGIKPENRKYRSFSSALPLTPSARSKVAHAWSRTLQTCGSRLFVRAGTLY